MYLFDAIKLRRSIRHYKPDMVEEVKISTVLDAARWAPSWGNTQCCRFVVVKDQEIKAKLSETLTSWNPSRSTVKEVPIVIVACAELGESGYKDGNVSTNKGDWYMFDVALAMQNLSLAACALGLGTVHIGAFDAQEVARILNVPEGVAVVEMMPLGYPAREGKAPPRKELSDMVFYEHYGERGK